MPIKPNNTDKVDTSKNAKHPENHPADVERATGTTRYGMGQQAKFNPDADVTDKQEYKSGGLPQMEKYSHDKDSKI